MANFGSDHISGEEEQFRMRLDSEYVWEGEEMMYEDIVASTQPANYNLLTRLKHADNYNFFQSYHTREQEEEPEETEQLDI